MAVSVAKGDCVADGVVLDLLASARQLTSFQIINDLKPELLEPALRGEHVGTIVRRDPAS